MFLRSEKFTLLANEQITNLPIVKTWVYITDLTILCLKKELLPTVEKLAPPPFNVRSLKNESQLFSCFFQSSCNLKSVASKYFIEFELWQR